MAKPKDIQARDRGSEAVRLRVDGHTYEEIAEILGFSGRASAYNAVNAVLERQEVESVNALRLVAGTRYDVIIAQMMPVLTATTTITENVDGKPMTRKIQVHAEDERAKAARTILRAQDSLNRLFGLNANPNTPVRNSQLLIVEAETLSNNMQEALMENPQPVDLGPIVDVVVDDE